MAHYTRTADGGYLLSRAKLEQAIERVKHKVYSILDADDTYGRAQWQRALDLAWKAADDGLVDVYERLISKKHHDPGEIRMLVDSVRPFGSSRAYRSLSSMTHEHLEAFQMVRDEITDKGGWLSGRWHERMKELERIIFDDPAAAPMVCALIRTHGVVSGKTMRSLLSGIDRNATALVEGAL
jgi:hypothetical protein